MVICCKQYKLKYCFNVRCSHTFFRYATVECALCGFSFLSKTSLKYHLDSMHYGIKKGSKMTSRSRKCTDLRCMEKGCRCKFYNKQLFISHLKFDHSIEFDIRHLNFTTDDGNTFH